MVLPVKVDFFQVAKKFSNSGGVSCNSDSNETKRVQVFLGPSAFKRFMNAMILTYDFDTCCTFGDWEQCSRRNVIGSWISSSIGSCWGSPFRSFKFISYKPKNVIRVRCNTVNYLLNVSFWDQNQYCWRLFELAPEEIQGRVEISVPNLIIRKYKDTSCSCKSLFTLTNRATTNFVQSQFAIRE